jgi:membrane protein implicated in regulation of membrane protease activity
MLGWVGSAWRRAVEKTIRVTGEILSLTIMLFLGFAPAAAAIAVGCLIRSGLIALALVAGAGLVAFVVWRLRSIRDRRTDPVERDRSIERSEAMAPPVVAATMAPVTNGLLTFHDFNTARRRFDHW